MLIFETFGGFEESAVRVLNDWARLARGKTPEGEEPPWSARNFFPLLVPGRQHVRAEGGGRGDPEQGEGGGGDP